MFTRYVLARPIATVDGDLPVNWYKHHLGDYSAATSHLTWNEDCAYRRLMDAYYKREQPIPGDINAACRLVRATSAAEKKAVATVLEEFFTLREDGWHNRRCDAEIAAASLQAETNKRIAKEREENRRHTRSVHETSTNRSRSTQSSVNPPRLQIPDSINHTHPSALRAAMAPTGAHDGVSVCFDDLTQEGQETMRGAVDALLQAGIDGAGLNHPRLLVQVQKGASVEQYRHAARDSSRKGKGIEYVLGTVRNQLEAARSDARELPAAKLALPAPAGPPPPPLLTPEQLAANREKAAAALALAKQTLGSKTFSGQRVQCPPT